jgi:hypothetical protein
MLLLGFAGLGFAGYKKGRKERLAPAVAQAGIASSLESSTRFVRLSR